MDGWKNYFRGISIHAPREGSDLLAVSCSALWGISIHAPREGSDRLQHLGLIRRFVISIHAPREGSDTILRPFYPGGDYISIHAPREGSDSGRQAGKHRPQHFYPRSPRGERHVQTQEAGIIQRISIHAPREGSDAVCAQTFMHKGHISIHAPREGSDRFRHSGPRRYGISIHAPREGSDAFVGAISAHPSDFYPRSPRGERHLR